MKSSGFNIEDTHLRDIDRLIITHSIPHSFFASILAAISFVKNSNSVFFSTFSIVISDFFGVFGRWCFSVSAEETVGNVSGVSISETRKQLLSCYPDVS